MIIDGADTLGEFLSEIVALFKDGAFLRFSTSVDLLLIREEVVKDLLSISQSPILEEVVGAKFVAIIFAIVDGDLIIFDDGGQMELLGLSEKS